MQLSIVNYGLDTCAEVPSYAKKEDDRILKISKEIVDSRDFGTGALIVSEVFHTDLRNSNFRKYMNKGMKESVNTFFSPHITPFLMHHEMGGGGLFSGGDSNLLSVGSNIYSEYIKRKVETPLGVASGYGKVATFVASDSMVGNQRAIDALRSRRLLTVSLGARVDDKNYRCSICGKSLYDEECEHSLGSEYDEGLCIAEVYSPLFREYSAVYNPSDIFAAIRRMDVSEGVGSDERNIIVDQEPANGYLQVYEDIGTKIHTSVQVQSQGGDVMGKNEDTSTNDTTDSNVSMDDKIEDLIEAYEEELKRKDDIIISLANTLKTRIENTDNINLSDILKPDSSDTSEDTNTDDTSTSSDNVTEDNTNEPVDNSDNQNDITEDTESTNTASDDSSDSNSDQTEDTSDTSDTGDNSDVSEETENNSSDTSNESDNDSTDINTDESQNTDSTTDASDTDSGSSEGKKPDILNILDMNSLGNLSQKKKGSLGDRSIVNSIKRNQ